jgi:hypothetical protein
MGKECIVCVWFVYSFVYSFLAVLNLECIVVYSFGQNKQKFLFQPILYRGL